MDEVPELAPARSVGTKVRRREDARLLTGGARHVGDMRLPDMVHVSVLRSPLAHARIVSIDAESARTAEGVVGVYTSADLAGKVAPFVESARDDLSPTLYELIDLEVKSAPMSVFASDRVLWVGQPVAAVVAVDPYLAEDALELIDVEYDPLPALVDPERALEEGAPVLHPELGNNVHSHLLVACGDVERALADAEHRSSERFEIGRQLSSAIEPRGVLAAVDERGLTIWATNNKPHLFRTFVSRMLGIADDRVRFVSPDMGGSFGGGIFPEDVLIPFLASELRRPVRWLEDRRENLLATSHGRDQTHEVEIGFRGDGTMVALRDRYLMDVGAYNTYAVTVPYNTVAHLRSQYRIDHFSVEGTVVVTTKAPAVPVRGAGRPEATFVIERSMDLVARELGLDRAEVRRRNLIRPEDMPYDMGIPYRDTVPIRYEAADFPAQLDAALEAFDHEGWRERQRIARSEGRRIGLGIAAFVEGSGHGPFEDAIVRLDEHGRVTVVSGARPHGQGHETVLSQVVADQLGMDPGDVIVRTGDTGLLPHGRGSFASRTAVMAGSAAAIAAAKLRTTILRVAGRMLDVDPEELTLERGAVYRCGEPNAALDLRRVAAEAGPMSLTDPGGEPGLAATHHFVPPTATFGSGTHVVAVEVDGGTGGVRVLDYVTVDECGTMLNPMIVEGQVHGGVAHGIGNALLEEAVYDEDGQLLTTTYMDYLLPTTMDVPPIRVGHQVFPSDRNPLGAKGVGEGGAVGAPAAVVSAVEDALGPSAARLTRIPLSPERVLEAIREGEAGGDGRGAGEG
ncbi:MAG: xanthine dehydrogenase family protein molybdopterin-binding subunit [Actinomycetota bacterium]